MEAPGRPPLESPRGRAVALYLAAAVIALGAGMTALIVAIVLLKSVL